MCFAGHEKIFGAENAPFGELLNHALRQLLVNTKLGVVSNLGEEARLTEVGPAAHDIAEEHIWSNYRS